MHSDLCALSLAVCVLVASVGSFISGVCRCFQFVFCLICTPGARLQNILTICLDFIVGSTYDIDLQCAKLFPWNIAHYFTNAISDDLTILQVNRI